MYQHRFTLESVGVFIIWESVWVQVGSIANSFQYKFIWVWHTGSFPCDIISICWGRCRINAAFNQESMWQQLWFLWESNWDCFFDQVRISSGDSFERPYESLLHHCSINFESNMYYLEIFVSIDSQSCCIHVTTLESLNIL